MPDESPFNLQQEYPFSKKSYQRKVNFEFDRENELYSVDLSHWKNSRPIGRHQKRMQGDHSVAYCVLVGTLEDFLRNKSLDDIIKRMSQNWKEKKDQNSGSESVKNSESVEIDFFTDHDLHTDISLMVYFCTRALGWEKCEDLVKNFLKLNESKGTSDKRGLYRFFDDFV